MGSNQGVREANLREALNRLEEGLKVVAISSLYETEPVGFLDQPWFLNAVVEGSTDLSPQKLLILAKKIEADMGRVPSFPNAPRPIDVDILFYGDQVLATPHLTVPHPRLTERAFVLVPLVEIAPGLSHPVLKKTMAELLARLEVEEKVRAWAPRGWAGRSALA